MNLHPQRSTAPPLRIGIMGDLIDGFEPHVATSSALEHSSLALGVKVASAWLPTEEIERDTPRLREFNGLWAAPGSPYRSFAGMLAGIRLAREQGIPLLGTCGGFQHVVIEFARHVAGLLHADSQEHSPAGAADLVVTPGDACELAGKSMLVRLERGSLPHTIYGRTDSQYRNCTGGGKQRQASGSRQLERYSLGLTCSRCFGHDGRV
jgi:CTP synthase (UTP-ammonia lyase)